MIKKEKTITYTLQIIEKEELEKAVSKHFGAEIKLGEMDVSLYDCLPLDTGKPDGFYFNITVHKDDILDNFVDSFDLAEENNWPEEFGTIAFIEEENIFDFDVSEFNFFERELDTSD